MSILVKVDQLISNYVSHVTIRFSPSSLKPGHQRAVSDAKIVWLSFWLDLLEPVAKAAGSLVDEEGISGLRLDALSVVDVVFGHCVINLASITDAYSNVLDELFLLLLVVCRSLDLLDLLTEAVFLVKVELDLPVLAFVMLSLLLDATFELQGQPLDFVRELLEGHG